MTDSSQVDAQRFAVIFDMDGLMLNSEPIYRLACVTAASALGCSVTDELYHQLLGRTEADSEGILQTYFEGRLDVNAFRRLWSENFSAAVERSGMERKDGLDDLLDALDARSILYAVATSTGRERARHSLAAAGLLDRFSTVVFGDEVRNGKPDPEIFLTAATRLGVDPSLCIVLEDSDAGILAAARAGMRPIMVPDLKAPSEEAARAAVVIARSLREVTPFVLAMLDDAV